MSEVDMQDVLRELHAAIEKLRDGADREPGEFTVKEYAETNGMKPAKARYHLEIGVTHGLVTSRKSTTKANLKFYRKVGEDDG